MVTEKEKSLEEKILSSAKDLPDLLVPYFANRAETFLNALSRDAIPFPEDPRVLESLPMVFGVSDFVAGVFGRRPELLSGLLDTGDLWRPLESPGLEARLAREVPDHLDEEGLMAALRLLRQREMARIAWRDLAGWAKLPETMAGLSLFADAVIGRAMDLLHRRLVARFGEPLDEAGNPQRMVVMGLGKLGARELNFSSDVDLIFAFPRGGDTAGPKTISNQDFFTRLSRSLIRVLSEKTPEGFVFRMDMRLRPYGGSGPMALSFSAMEDYYQMEGRDWERYAWIKARPVAGDINAGNRLLELLRPFVYRKYMDYGAFESLREMKRMIADEVRKKGLSHDIKTGAGGIREVEFIGQVLQLIRGGVTPELRIRSILKVLGTVQNLGLLPPHVCQDLAQAYVFLRNTEHRLQEFSDRQTHKLPDGDVGRVSLAYSMGHNSWPAFAQALDAHRSAVHGHFQELLAPGSRNPEKSSLFRVWKGEVERVRALRLLEEAGYRDPENALAILETLRESSAVKRLGEPAGDLLDRLATEFAKRAGESDQSGTVLSRLCDLLHAICGRTSYLSLLVENPQAVENLVPLYEASPLIAEQVKRHPWLLDELTDARTLYAPPEKQELLDLMELRLADVDPEDLEEAMETLRVYKEANTFRVAAADVTGSCYIMRVSDHLTDIAEVVLQRSVDLAWTQTAKRHGEPDCELNGEAAGRGFAVVGFGKLGGIELSYGSDLDLVFLHAGKSGGFSNGPKPLDNATFFARLGQKVVHILSAHTPAGVLYQADMRLRPSGESGMLVSHVEAYRDYQENEAWTWEHMALVRARPVAGNPAIARRFVEIRKKILTTVREPEKLRQDVTSMRSRMRKELLDEAPGFFDLKQGPGGIVDIEFLVQYVVLLKAREHPELLRWTDNVRILETLAGLNLLPENQAGALNDAYLALRAEAHRLVLLQEKSKVPEKPFLDIRRTVQDIWHDILES